MEKIYKVAINICKAKSTAIDHFLCFIIIFNNKCHNLLALLNYIEHQFMFSLTELLSCWRLLAMLCT